MSKKSKQADEGKITTPMHAADSGDRLLAGIITAAAPEKSEMLWAGPYPPCKSKDGKAFLGNAVYQALPCGCQVIGNGTLPDPLTVQLCPMHAADSGDRLLAGLRAAKREIDQALTEALGPEEA